MTQTTNNLFKLAMAVGFVLWVASLPIVVLGIGFSGAEILSPVQLIKDILNSDPYAWNRLWALAVVLAPVMALWLYLRRRRKSRTQ
jgi:hypothetical protein